MPGPVAPVSGMLRPMPGSGRLAGEVAIITGSTSGLGKEVARRFAVEGAAVVVSGRDADRGNRVIDTITGDGGVAIFLAADLADDAACSDLVAATVERFGGLTVLVNNAVNTTGGDGDVTSVESETWARILRINVVAVAVLCRVAIPHMVRAGHGAIVNISSRAAERPSPGLAAYAASKGALNALTRAIAVDFAPHNVRCNTISPGYVVHERRDAELDDNRRRRLEAMHLSRLGTPEDVAHAAVYLASQEAQWVTGINLQLDGGSSIARAASFG
jgi:glucose 1-dehydrogenase